MGIFQVVGWITEMEMVLEREMHNLGKTMMSDDLGLMPGMGSKKIRLQMLSPDQDAILRCMEVQTGEVDFRIAFKDHGTYRHVGFAHQDFSGYITKAETNISIDGPALTEIDIEVIGQPSWS